MQKYLKAVYAAVFAALGATSSAYIAGGNHVGVVAGVSIATTALTAFGVVWGVPNAPSTANIVWGNEPPAPPQA